MCECDIFLEFTHLLSGEAITVSIV